MSRISQSTYPGGSRQRVNRAGDAARDNKTTAEDLGVIDEWRAAHRPVLNTFQAILRSRTRYSKIVVAQRHKRRRTIFDKLRRFPKMKLSRMDDVAGCRLIFGNIDELYAFRDKLHKARFNHELKNEKNKYDYIKDPKQTGYRSIHDIYAYNVNSEHGKEFKGLLIELQYRTIYQHAWATCVEVVGFITESQPKFEKGDNRYLRILRLASEIIARTCENMRSSLQNLSDDQLVNEFLEMDQELHFMALLRSLNTADSEISDNKNVILIFSEDDLEMKTYRDAPEALRALFDLEKKNPGKDIVLVRADTSEDVRLAFTNYFSDARQFINLIDDGCAKLTKSALVVAPADFQKL